MQEMKNGILNDSNQMDKLMEFAGNLGTSAACLVAPNLVEVDERFPKFCLEPGCPDYGLSMSCPPHVEGPEGFCKKLSTTHKVLVFKFDVPSRVLLSNERQDVMRLIHDTAATLETHARDLGFSHSLGYAGGGCKNLFCREYLDCQVLAGDGFCRNPQRARPSMSGMGVDFKALCDRLGWVMQPVCVNSSKNIDPDHENMSFMAGMVLVRA